MLISIIVAVAENDIIGNENQLPWHLPADLKHFKNLTMGHHIVMGRKTFESIGKPLIGRKMVIISKQKDYKVESCFTYKSLETALQSITNDDEIFIIGGASIYQIALPFVSRIYLTQIHQNFAGDTFFPHFRQNEWEIIDKQDFEPDEKNKFPYTFLTMQRKSIV